MKQNHKADTVLISVLLFILVTFSACAVPERDQAEPATPVVEQSEDASASDPAEASGPTGLDIPLDGSSLEAFEQSMDKISKTSSASDYKTLQNAIDYLLLYDLKAQGDLAIVAAHLDGMTGQEILEKVNWRRKGK